MRVLFLFFILSPFISIAQESNDPEATLILDDISNTFLKAETVSIDFDLIIKMPELEEEIQKGTLLQDGEKFHVKISDREIISNGIDVYVISEEMKSAQLNSVESMDGSQGVMNPKQLMTMYNDDDYIYSIVGEEELDGIRLIMIEFKPVDRYSEYSKLRLGVVKQTNSPYYIKIFNKDASRFTLKMTEVNYKPSFDPSEFKFNKNDYPNIVVEDLRID